MSSKPLGAKNGERRAAKVKKLFAFFLVAVLGVAGGTGIGFFFANEKVTTASETIPQGKDLEKRTFHTEEILSNLNDGFIKLSLSFITDSEEGAVELAKRDFQINNYVIKSLSVIGSDKINQTEEMNKVQNSIKKYLNDHMTTGEVVDVYVNQKLISK